MYNDIPEELLRLIEPVAEDRGLEIVDAVLIGGRARARLRVTVDTPAGDGQVTVDECAAFSREIGHVLDAENYVSGPYVLEVSSPGIDRTLGRAKDFARAVGQRVALETRQPLSGRRRFRGALVGFDGTDAEIRTDAGLFRIPLAQVARARAFAPEAPGRQKR